ncbi:MAG: hypothetical protein M3081_17265 [Gemmatimonadota bacterium]|nr:hypothetical protein [Gemmatimonadota bacterium]
MRRSALWFFTVAISACSSGPPRPPAGQPLRPREAKRLPTGRFVQPVGNVVDVGSMPMNMVVTPERREIVISLSGWREQGLQVVDRVTGQASKTFALLSTFYGLAFSADEKSLFASGGNQDVIYRFDWFRGDGKLADSIILEPKMTGRGGVRFPAGLAPSRDGKTLYVAENLSDSLAVIDIPTRKVVARFATERYPFAVVVAFDGTVYVSSWGGSTVSAFKPSYENSAKLTDLGRIKVARHPSAMVLNGDGSRLFVASGSTDRVDVIDTEKRQVMAELLDPPPAGPNEGSTPNALALSIDGTRLFVAEADNNAVAVFNLSSRTANILAATGDDKLAGRVATGWYPTALNADGDVLLVLNGKGTNGSAPNPKRVQTGGDRRLTPREYTLGQLNGSLQAIQGRLPVAQLKTYTDKVAALNGWDTKRDTIAKYPPFEHVVYVIKENRTYDQVFGDLGIGDGDTSLVFFPRSASPNHRAMARRFGVFDRFFVNAEVSADGHNWSTAAYATDYVQKTVPSEYREGDRRMRAKKSEKEDPGRPYDYEGRNRGSGTASIPDDDVAAPANGYLWDLAAKAGITLRNYGEFVAKEGPTSGEEDTSKTLSRYRGTKPALLASTNTAYPGFNLNIQDQKRMDIYLAELAEYVRAGKMPALEIVRLPDDHTSGVDEGKPTPRAYFADNDLALGRMIEGLSKSPFWKSTVVFVVEDDAQNGPDHVDSHRAPFLVISPYTKAGVVHRFTNTTDVIATIADILHLGSMSQFDYFGTPLRDIWTTTPDLAPYAVLVPEQSLDQKNSPPPPTPAPGPRLDFSREDRVDDDVFNRILWRAIKGSAPYPGATRMGALEWKRSR